MLAMARGEWISDEACDELHKRYLDTVMLDGTLTPLAREVLVSGARDTPSGQVMVCPFLLTDPTEVVVLEQIESETNGYLYRLLRDRGDHQNDADPPLGRRNQRTL